MLLSNSSHVSQCTYTATKKREIKVGRLPEEGKGSVIPLGRVGWPGMNLAHYGYPDILISARSRTTAITGADPSPVAGSEV